MQIRGAMHMPLIPTVSGSLEKEMPYLEEKPQAYGMCTRTTQVGGTLAIFVVTPVNMPANQHGRLDRNKCKWNGMGGCKHSSRKKLETP